MNKKQRQLFASIIAGLLAFLMFFSLFSSLFFSSSALTVSQSNLNKLKDSRCFSKAVLQLIEV